MSCKKDNKDKINARQRLRRKTDINVVAMLLDIEANCTNLVICRHKNLLFARSIPIGAKQLKNEASIKKLVLELNGCKREFSTMYRNAQIDRLLFLSGHAVDRDICTEIAKLLEMPAQIGDCLAAVEIPNTSNLGTDRRDSRINWATAFGLSLL